MVSIRYFTNPLKTGDFYAHTNSVYQAFPRWGGGAWGQGYTNPWYSLNRTVTFAITRGQNKVYIPFLFYNYSIVQNVPFHFYGNFRSYVGMITDSATNGIERDE